MCGWFKTRFHAIDELKVFPALSLNISKNLPKIKAKEVGHVMEAIVNLIQVLNDKCSILLFFWKNTDY